MEKAQAETRGIFLEIITISNGLSRVEVRPIPNDMRWVEALRLILKNYFRDHPPIAITTDEQMYQEIPDA
jgi:hypothetical protein